MATNQRTEWLLLPRDQDGILPTLHVPQVLLAALITPVYRLWILTLPFGAALALIGHPWLGLGSCVANMIADTLAQRIYQRWQDRVEQIEPLSLERRIGLVVMLRAMVAVAWPLVAVLTRGQPVDLMFLGLAACLLMSVGVTQGALSARLYWMSAGPVLAALAVAIVAVFPPLPAAGLILSVLLMTVMLAVMSGGVSRVLSGWSEMRERNNDLIDRLKAEREEAEAAREEARLANQAKSRFLATMSHEIRTPMNAVLGMAQILQTTAKGGQKAQVRTLIDSGEFLMSILNDILDISRIDAGRMDIVATPQDIPALAEELAGFWGPAAEQKGLALTLHLDETLPPCLVLDGRRLRQVLFNLIGNALKFTPRGEIAVSFTALPDPAREHGVILTVSVRDSGIGIDPEVLPGLFRAFAQADDSLARSFGGTGLGLAITRQLTELMDGRIWAESRPGEGSVFHIAIPAPIGEAPAVEAPEAARPAVEAAPLAILAVDDNDVNLMVLDQILTASGHRVTKASSGPDALALMAAERFDLVLMDIQMPGMSGIEAVRHVRALPAPAAGTKVLAVTADVLTRGRSEFLEMGFDGEVSKPIQIAALLGEIAAVREPGRVRAAA